MPVNYNSGIPLGQKTYDNEFVTEYYIYNHYTINIEITEKIIEKGEKVYNIIGANIVPLSYFFLILNIVLVSLA